MTSINKKPTHNNEDDSNTIVDPNNAIDLISKIFAKLYFNHLNILESLFTSQLTYRLDNSKV